MSFKKMLLVGIVLLQAILSPKSTQPQWSFIEKLMKVYQCSGEYKWVRKVSGGITPIRLLLTINKYFFCGFKYTTQDATPLKDFLNITGSLNKTDNHFQCLKLAIKTAGKRVACANPNDVKELVDLSLDTTAKIVVNANTTNRNTVVMLETFARYFKQLRIRNEMLTLHRMFNMCQDFNTKRKKRQFDAYSTLALWDTIIRFRDQYPHSNGHRNTIKQMVYVLGDLYQCLMGLIRSQIIVS